MVNMRDVIKPKSDQINAEDLLAGPVTVTVEKVEIDLSKEQPVSVFVAGNDRPFKPCKSMNRIMAYFWGEDQREYSGRSMTLYRDEEVTWGGEKVGGVRISHMSHMEGTKPVKVALAANKKQRKPFTITPLIIQKPQAPQPEPEVSLDAANLMARTAAAGGAAAFRSWWNSDAGKSCRLLVKPIMAELQKTAADADAQEADPFGLPAMPDDRHANQMTDDELAAQSRAEEEFARQRAAELENN